MQTGLSAAPPPASLALIGPGRDSLALPAHRDDFARLTRLLARPGHFALIVAQCEMSAYRQALIAAATDRAEHPGSVVWTLPWEPSPDTFIDQLVTRAHGASALHVVGLEPWLAQLPRDFWRQLNYRRETLAERARLPIVLWLAPPAIRPFAEYAPDLWAWRAAVLDFTLPTTGVPALQWASLREAGTIDRERARERIAQIDAYLENAPDTETTADLLLEAAIRRAALGDWVGAGEHADRALQHYRTLGKEIGATLALHELGKAEHALGRSDKAVTLLQEALAHIEAALGGSHPTAAVILTSLAAALDATGRRAEAESLLRRALAIDERVFGPDHPRVAGDLNDFARMLVALGSPTEAMELFDRAIGIFESETPEWPLRIQNDLAGAYSNRGIAHLHQGQVAAAIADFDHAAGILEDLRGRLGTAWPPPMQEALCQVYSNRGTVYAEKHEYAAARRDFERAVEVIAALAAAYPENPHWQARLKEAERLRSRALRLAESPPAQ